MNLLQTLVETLLFYHPAVWWVSHQIRIERENCCDDLAVSLCGDPILYAQALAELEHLRGAPLAPGDGGQRRIAVASRETAVGRAVACRARAGLARRCGLGCRHHRDGGHRPRGDRPRCGRTVAACTQACGAGTVDTERQWRRRLESQCRARGVRDSAHLLRDGLHQLRDGAHQIRDGLNQIRDAAHHHLRQIPPPPPLAPEPPEPPSPPEPPDPPEPPHLADLAEAPEPPEPPDPPDPPEPPEPPQPPEPAAAFDDLHEHRASTRGQSSGNMTLVAQRRKARSQLSRRRRVHRRRQRRQEPDAGRLAPHQGWWLAWRPHDGVPC